MTSSILKKYIVTPLVLSGAVFAALTLPLNKFGSKPIVIQMQGEPLAFGQVEEFAPLYLGVTGMLSAGVGVVSVALAGWQESSRKSAETQKKISRLMENIQDKQQLLESLKQSQAELNTSSSERSLDEEIAHQNTLESQPSHFTNPVSVAENTEMPLTQQQDIEFFRTMAEELLEATTVNPENYTQLQSPLVVNSEDKENEEVIVPLHESKVVRLNSVTSPQVQAIAAKFASAQTFFGYTQTKNSAQSLSVSASSVPTVEVEQIDGQLEQLMERITFMRTALHSAPQPVASIIQPNNDSPPNFAVISKN
ncbi:MULTISPECIES: hypothetical protein [unclassified Coleofasciculus]|uniref:hypothetical protein n=1 Tax=unclassified Coleofasciculus TaxID=2692782 RepID=UPI00187F7F6C|nr:MULTISPECIES: hypothetical protein [unclassified Coleofasciculus]MBE9125039.1 hypothetical protein [Coleofasciculus sp. LEGE 07081]MBE9147641.1 hypothetical protein [Coleofasciculus sp. LEGE 07092]